MSPNFLCCAVCGRSVKTRIPKGGDGSAQFPYKHKLRYGGHPFGERYDCDGHLQEAVTREEIARRARGDAE